MKIGLGELLKGNRYVMLNEYYYRKPIKIRCEEIENYKLKDTYIK